MNGLNYTDKMADEFIELVKNAPIFMMSIDTSSPLESNKFLIPNNYQLNDLEWCEKFMRNTVEGFQKFPWEKRIEKAYFRGRPTGPNRDHFKATIFPPPNDVSNIVLEEPEAWSRPYLVKESFHNQQRLVDAKLVDL